MKKLSESLQPVVRTLAGVLPKLCVAVLAGGVIGYVVTIATTDDSLPFRPRVLMDPFDAIVDVSLLKAADVKDEVLPNELVLGVVVNGKARAYPINQLTGPSREIINDELGGSAIAATW